MLLALITHGTTVIPVKVIQIRVILMGFCTGVGCATCIVLPRSTLQSRKLHKNVKFQISTQFYEPNHYTFFLCCRAPHYHLKVKLSFWTRDCFVVFGIHTHIEFVFRQGGAGEGQQQYCHNPHHSVITTIILLLIIITSYIISWPLRYGERYFTKWSFNCPCL